MKKYLISSILISAFLVSLYLFDSFFSFRFHKYFPWLIGFFFVQSIGISWMLSIGEKDKGKLPILALGSVVLRFLTALFFLMIFFIVGLENPNALVIQFMVLYLLYMGFELTLVLANLRQN